MDFFYPNFQNDMWRIMGLIFFRDKNHFIITGEKKFDKDKIVEFCMEKGIALGDTALEVIRLKENASDKYLEVKKSLDLSAVLKKIPECRSIIITGEKAMDTILTVISAEKPAIGSFSRFVLDSRELRLYRTPSSSRAYPKPLEEKAEIWSSILQQIYSHSIVAGGLEEMS